ncbi:ATP-binding protein [Pseudonocardia humida]|uniref:Histidine kinase/HSP90-like ATPase domain-containing protein n=1 Tax=Pseudonocardia humida TaxID=2800819 RepID=A0ABT1A3Y4_9PSEU|nr:ATP-binding protein [Pseudonocardia humida]MCO1657722.1 hypothetical protein [Pseudonocardia humida]
MTGVLTAVRATITGGAHRGAGLAAATARAGLGVLLVLSAAVSVIWLVLGVVAAAVRYSPQVAASLGASGSWWARAAVDAAPASGPLGQLGLDYGFSTLNLVLAVVLITAGPRTWSIRLLAVALAGSAGAFNMQAHAASRGLEQATGLTASGVHGAVLLGTACAAYVLALLLFPTPPWDLMSEGWPVRRALVVVGTAAFALVGLGAALLPHTANCVLFFGFVVPVVGLVVLPRRVRRGPGAAARTQARLLFSMVVGGFAVMAVLAVVTLLLDLLGAAPYLALVEPTEPRSGTDTAGPVGDPTALLFWFSRLASAAIAVVVLLAARQDRLWTAEHWFSRGLAVLLVGAVGGGGFVLLGALADGVVDAGVAEVAAGVAAAVALGPLCIRVERLVDRLLYGRRPAPYRVLADVTALLRSSAASSSGSAPDLAQVAEAIARGLGAGVCRLTVRRPGLRDRRYEWADRTGGFDIDDLVEVPVRHGDEQVGALAVDRQAVSGVNAQREQLFTDIADGLGVVLEASRSAIELERQLRAALAHAEEIAVSRRRAVAEMDSERRRIERDLHDGAQHNLVSLRLALGLVEHHLGTGELDLAQERLGVLTEQLAAAEAVLAATADGVSSQVVAQEGLVPALRAELAAAHPPIDVETDGVPDGRRFPADVAAAVWFCCTESVGNARKHAAGAPVTVRLAERAGALAFTVRDEGPGFDPAADAAGGRGLRNMATRIAAVGGVVTIRSAPGAGTTVEGSVPVPPEGGSAAPPSVDEPTVPTTARGSAATTVLIAVPQPEPTAVVTPVPTAVPASGPTPGPTAVPDVEAPTVPAFDPPTMPAVDPVAVPEPPREPAPESAPEEVAADLPLELPRLAGQVRALARATCVAYRGTPAQSRVDDLAHRLDEPLRIAVLGAVDDLRRMLVEAMVGTPAVPPPPAAPVPVRYVYGDERVESGPAAVVALPAPALRAMTLIDVPTPRVRGPERLSAEALGQVRALVGTAGGEPPGADAFVLLLHYGRPADMALLDLLHAAGQRAIGVLARADDPTGQGGAAAAEYAADPAVRRVCHTVVPVAPATAVAAARLGDEEHRLLQRWATGDPADTRDAATALIDRLGPLGARRALALVRCGEGGGRAELAAALVRHSGLADLQEVVASRFLRRSDPLRTRSVLTGLDTVLGASPPPGESARSLRYQLERVRAGAHELREIELLDALRSGELGLPGDERRVAERLLGAAGADVRVRLGVAVDTTAGQVRSATAHQAARWRALAAHPVVSTRAREAAQVLVRTCERLGAEVDDPDRSAGDPPGEGERPR